MIVEIKPRLGREMALGCSLVSNVIATFYYQEVGQPEHQDVLVENTHYSLADRTGQIELLPHALWDTMGYWRAGDREETLLYKGQVKAPQRVEVSFDFFDPVDVTLGGSLVGSTLTIDLTAEADGDVVLAAYGAEGKIGTLTVAVAGGVGQHVMTIGANVPADAYTITTDPDTLDPAWGVPTHQTETPLEVEVT